MSPQMLPLNVSLQQGQSLVNYFKSFINYFYFQAKLYSNNDCFKYYNKNGKLIVLSYADVDRITTNLACELKNELNGYTDTVSYINDHGIDYAITMLAILKLRLTLFTVSPRNSKAAVVHLLDKVDSKVLICSSKYEPIAEESTSELPEAKLITKPPLDFERFLEAPLNPESSRILSFDFNDEDLSKSTLIIHSSGTTSFPKPMYLSNRYLINVMRLLDLSINQREGLAKLTEKDRFISVLPLFHIAGIFTCYGIFSFGSSTVFLSNSPPSMADILTTMINNKVTVLPGAPIIYENVKKLIDETNDFSAFKYVKYAFFGSASIKKEMGTWYHQHNINLQNIYGLTETGPILTSSNDPTSDNWLSLAPLDYSDYIVFEPEDPNDPSVLHLHVKPGCPFLATNANNASDGGYDTNDLFKEDPHHPGYYTYLGRRDDTLILENGEKVNPIPIEQTICGNPIVKHAAVAGHNRQCASALVEVNTNRIMSYTPQQVIDSVQTSVKQANTESPSHSVIFPEMVKIIPFKRSLPTTDKGTVKRKVAYVEYQEELDKMYGDFLNKVNTT